MPFKHEDKKAGDVLKSADWNAGMQEVMRLDKDKVDRKGDTITGSLSIGDALTVVGSATIGDTKTQGSRASLTLQGRIPGETAATLTLQNTVGSAGAGGALDFNGYSVGNNAPTARIRSLDDGNYSSHLGFYTKQSGAANNPLQERLRIQSNGDVGIGIDIPKGKLNIVHTSQDANGNALVLGSTDASNLRLGYHESYSWIQSHGSKPLSINSLGNNVGIGTTDPKARLQVTGTVNITSGNGNNPANTSNCMAAGSLTIGGVDRNYGGGNGWNTNTAGLLLETQDNTEIAVHDAGLRLASLMYYESTSNKFTIGRDMGWGAISTVEIAGDLRVNKAITPSVGNVDTAGIMFPRDAYGGGGDAAWMRYYARSGEACTLEIGISNDWDDHIALMSSGNVGIGTISPTAKLEVNGVAKVSKLQLGNKFLLSGIGDHEADDTWLRLKNTSNTAYYGGFAAESLWCSVKHGSLSDKRKKENIKPLTNSLEKILLLQGVSFNWKGQQQNTCEQVGLIAQDVEKVFPQTIVEGPDGMKGIAYNDFIALLIEAIREQNSKIQDLQEKIGNLG